MVPFYLLFLFYLMGTALGAAVPVAILALSPRQIVENPAVPQNTVPPDVTPQITLPAPPTLSSITGPRSTILGLPLVTTTIIQSSITTSIVPSSTTTRTFTSTPPPSFITTILSSTTVILDTVETVSIQTSPPPTPTDAAAVNTGPSSNGAAGSVVWDGGIGIRLCWTVVLGLLLVIKL